MCAHAHSRMHQETKQNEKPTPNRCPQQPDDGGPAGGRNPVTQGGRALIWLRFYGCHKPDGPQLVLLGQTASLPEVIQCDQQYF